MVEFSCQRRRLLLYDRTIIIEMLQQIEMAEFSVEIVKKSTVFYAQ